MQSPVADSTFVGPSRLEFYADPDAAPECTPLEKLPLLVGRAEDAELRVNSGRVSRQHAVIECADGQWTIRDLNSTNGTFVNGQRITTKTLRDGDLISIADTAFTFRTDNGGADDDAQRMTQTMFMPSERQPADVAAVADWVGHVRRFQECVLHGGYVVNLTAVVPIVGDKMFGQYMEAVAGATHRNELPFGGLSTSSSRLTRRYSASARVVAVRKAIEAKVSGRLFLSVDACEARDWPALHSQLEWLKQQVPQDLVPVLAISGDAAADAEFVAGLHDAAKSLAVEICYAGFSGGRAEVRQFEDAAPDYVVISEDVVRGGRPSEQTRRQIVQLVQTFREVGCDPIVRAPWNERNRSILRDLGFQYLLKARWAPS